MFNQLSITITNDQHDASEEGAEGHLLPRPLEMAFGHNMCFVPLKYTLGHRLTAVLGKVQEVIQRADGSSVQNQSSANLANLSITDAAVRLEIHIEKQ